MSQNRTESGAHPGQQSVFAVVLNVDSRPLRADSRVFLRIADSLHAGALASIEDRLRRSDLQLGEVPAKQNDLALIKIYLEDAQQSSLTGMVPIELLSEARSCIASGVLIPGLKADGDRRQGLAVWLTGLSGAGKTTIASGLQRRLRGRVPVEMLDADIVRTHLCKGLGYTREDRDENVRRLGFLAKVLTQTGAVVLVSAISPYRAVRDEIRKEIGKFIEVHVNAPLEVCESRDVKGLYKKARRGELQRFTGISDPYEPPLTPDVECRTDRESMDESIAKVLAQIEQKLKSG
jgi:adenylylsulfate kinase